MNKNLRGIAKMKCEVQWDGSDDDLVEFIDTISDEGLDSKDLGDAMGWIIVECFNSDYELTLKSNQGNTLTATILFDLFEWDRVDPMPPI